MQSTTTVTASSVRCIFKSSLRKSEKPPRSKVILFEFLCKYRSFRSAKSSQCHLKSYKSGSIMQIRQHSRALPERRTRRRKQRTNSARRSSDFDMSQQRHGYQLLVCFRTCGAISACVMRPEFSYEIN